MNVLSLFDGMSCGQIALKELGIIPEKYYAAEIDKFAVQQTQHNFSNTIQLGSVTEWPEWNIDWKSIDLLIGGSPCQGFSFAGKQLNFEDPRSQLFFEFVKILNHIRKFNPDVKFLLENVNMKKEYLGVISDYLGIIPVRINSNLVSAQNRDRWYWSNIKTKSQGLFGELQTDIEQPQDKGVLLKDILQPESEIDKKYYLSDVGSKYSLSAIFKQDRPHSTNAEMPCLQATRVEVVKIDKQGNEKADQNKAGCLTAGGHSGGNHSDMDIICVAMRGRNPENPSVSNSWEHNNHLVLGCDYRTDEGLRIRQNGKSGTLAAMARNDESCGQLAIQNYKLRRLTPLECSRLQTIPEWYQWIVSDSQIYKMLGNGWTVEVIKHIFKNLKKDESNV